MSRTWKQRDAIHGVAGEAAAQVPPGSPVARIGLPRTMRSAGRAYAPIAAARLLRGTNVST